MMDKFIKIENQLTEKPKKSGIWNYFVHIVALSVGFTIGYYYNVFSEIKLNSNKPKIVKEITRSSVSIAVDDHNNLMVIDKNTGDYLIYQDSIGVSIFDMYAKKIVTTHTP